jgi:hypothetical protein
MLVDFARSAKPKPTIVFNTYWHFAAERQRIFFHRCAGASAPWTTDIIMGKHRFTNVYRVLDRVSQFLVRSVIYQGAQDIDEVFFRTILFKIFNRIETWQRLTHNLGKLTWAAYDFKKYDTILTEAMSDGVKIFSPAYIMPSGKTQFGGMRKHSNYLRLLEHMMAEDVPKRLATCHSMKDAFTMLRSYPLLGDFLAYQYLIDLNYSEAISFSEMEFVVAGPGAQSGLKKCFSTLGELSPADAIRWVTDTQEENFERLGLDFQTLYGRRLHLIDCQNLFCEVDKYARVKHPEFSGKDQRFRIKRRFQPSNSPVAYWFPPKWGLVPALDMENFPKLASCI